MDYKTGLQNYTSHNYIMLNVYFVIDPSPTCVLCFVSNWLFWINFLVLLTVHMHRGNFCWCLVNSHQTISHQSQLTPFLVNSPYIWNKEGLFWGGLLVFSTYCVTRHWVFSTYFGTTISTPISKGEFLWLTIKACSYNI